MHPHAGHNPYAYYGEQPDPAYPSQTRPQDPNAWPQEMYTSAGPARSHHPPPPPHSWGPPHQNPYGSQYPPPHPQWGPPGPTAQGMAYSSGPSYGYPGPSSAPPPEPAARWQPPDPVAVHTYERLPSADKDVVDAWLEKDTEKRVYRCRGNSCGKEFSSKDNARVHVHGKHLGQNKLFRCVQCRTEFASEDGAKRHRDTATTKTFSCPYCSNTYARKDYRDLHQKKCTSRGSY